MVNVAEVSLLLPQSSVAVKVTVALPVAPQSSLSPSKSLDQVTPLQMSLAAAPPWLASQALRASVLPAPSHSTVSSEEAVSMDGAVVSSMVNVAVVSLLLPQSSVAVKVTVTAPVAPQRSLSVASLWLQATALQLSLASAPPLSASQSARSWVLPAPSHSTVRSAAARSMDGSVSSVTVIVWSQEAVDVRPQWSIDSMVQVRVMM